MFATKTNCYTIDHVRIEVAMHEGGQSYNNFSLPNTWHCSLGYGYFWLEGVAYSNTFVFLKYKRQRAGG